LPGRDGSNRNGFEVAGLEVLTQMRSRAAWYTAIGAVRANTGCDYLQAQTLLNGQPQDPPGTAADRLLAVVEAHAQTGVDPDAFWD
jgi:hypothetical protein